MANLSRHLEPQWELFRNEPLKAQLRREVIMHRREEIDQGRGGPSEHWWYDQRYVDKVVPAEYVDPDGLDTFNYRYQVYARHPPKQCEPRSLAEVTNERPPLRYNIKRISQGKPLEVSLPRCDSQWGAKSYVLECHSTDNNENHCRSKDNSCLDRQTNSKWDNAIDTIDGENDKMPPVAEESEEIPRRSNACQNIQDWNYGEHRSKQRHNYFPVTPSHKLNTCTKNNVQPLSTSVSRLTNRNNLGASLSCSSGCTSRSSSPCCVDNINQSNRCGAVSRMDLRKGAMHNSGSMVSRRDGNGKCSSPSSDCKEQGYTNNDEIMSPWSAPSERSQSTLSCVSNGEIQATKQPISGVDMTKNDVIEHPVKTGSRVNVDRSDEVGQTNARSEECVSGGKFAEVNRDMTFKTRSNDAIGSCNSQNDAGAHTTGPVAVACMLSLAAPGENGQSQTSINLNNNKRSSLSSETLMSGAKEAENVEVLRKTKRPSMRSGLYTIRRRTDSVTGLLVDEEYFDISKDIVKSNTIHERPDRCLEIHDKKFGRRFGCNAAALKNNIAGLFETKLGRCRNVIGHCTKKTDCDRSNYLQTRSANCASVEDPSSVEITQQKNERFFKGDCGRAQPGFQKNKCIGSNTGGRSGKRMGYQVTAQRDSMGSLLAGNYKETNRTGRRSCQDGGYSSMADSDNLKSLLSYQMSDNNNNNIRLISRDFDLQCSKQDYVSNEHFNELREDLADVLNSRKIPYSPQESFEYAKLKVCLVDDFLLEGEDRISDVPNNGGNKSKLDRRDTRLELIRTGVKYPHGDVCLCTNNNSMYNNDLFEVDCRPLRLCKPQVNGAQCMPFRCRAKSSVRSVSKATCTGMPANGEPYNSGKHQPMECTVLPISRSTNQDLVLICEPRRNKTPEIGYGTYKIVGGLSHRHPPPADLLANLKLPPHLAEYTGFMRRCPNFTIGRYDKSDPTYETLLPANRTSQTLKMQLKPFVYARNPRAGKYPPLFHDPVTTRDLQWRLPVFVKQRGTRF